MTTPSVPHVEIESIEHFDRVVAAGATTMAGWRVQSVDLTARTADLLRLDPAGSLFLGDRLAPAAEEWIRAGGGLVFPNIPELPFDPYRGRTDDHGGELAEGVDLEPLPQLRRHVLADPDPELALGQDLAVEHLRDRLPGQLDGLGGGQPRFEWRASEPGGNHLILRVANPRFQWPATETRTAARVDAALAEVGR